MRLHFANTKISAQTGFSLTLKKLDGEDFNVTIDHIVECDDILRIPGKGMPRRSGRGYGDLFLTFEVDFPDDLSPDQKKKLREVLSSEENGRSNDSGEL